VFPAAFGGRRTNRGIYCETHNNAFGRHVAKLLNALDIANAIIGVIPDRHKEIRPAAVQLEDGERYLFSKDEAKIAPPPSLRETPELVGKRVQLKFADQAQADKWIAEQKKAGFQVAAEPAGPVRTQIFTQPLHAARHLGDEAFMRGLLYLALTFLAHGYPELARSSGLAKARDIVEKDEPVEDRVLWEPPGAMTQLHANPFAYGHTVVIGPISETKRVGALVSFYGAIQLGIDLGELADNCCLDRITTHIDPLAEKPPHDFCTVREANKSLALSTAEESRKYLHQLRTEQSINPLLAVLQSAGDEELSRTCEALLPELTALTAMSPSLRSHRIMELLTSHDQRIFNLLRKGIQGLSESAADLPEPIRVILKSFIAANDGAPRGLAPTSEAALQIAKAGLADAVLDELNNDSLDAKSLAALLGGGKGVSVVLRTLTNIIANSLPR
jgi:hypothetical protein